MKKTIIRRTATVVATVAMAAMAAVAAVATTEPAGAAIVSAGTFNQYEHLSSN